MNSYEGAAGCEKSGAQNVRISTASEEGVGSDSVEGENISFSSKLTFIETYV